MEFKKWVSRAGVALLVLALFLAWLWQPERQARLHQKHFLKAIENRNWDAASAFIAQDYTDRWNHDKTFILEGCSQVFGQFLFVTIEHRADDTTVSDGIATLRVPVKITGSGGPVAQAAMQTVNTLQTPFVFTWKRGDKPWDWHLIRVDHPDLDLDHVPSL